MFNEGLEIGDDFGGTIADADTIQNYLEGGVVGLSVILGEDGVIPFGGEYLPPGVALKGVINAVAPFGDGRELEEVADGDELYASKGGGRLTPEGAGDGVKGGEHIPR